MIEREFWPRPGHSVEAPRVSILPESPVVLVMYETRRARELVATGGDVGIARRRAYEVVAVRSRRH